MENGNTTIGEGEFICASIAQECERCEKKQSYFYTEIEENMSMRNAAHMLIRHDPDSVVVTVSNTGKYKYNFYKCSDTLCLLGHVRDALTYYWVQEQMRKFYDLQNNKKVLKRQHAKAKASRRRMKPSKVAVSNRLAVGEDKPADVDVVPVDTDERVENVEGQVIS